MHLFHIWRNLPALAPSARTFLQYGAAACGLYYLLYRVGVWRDDHAGAGMPEPQPRSACDTFTPATETMRDVGARLLRQAGHEDDYERSKR